MNPTAGFPCFDRPVARDGYLWWYIDALSDDGRHGLTLIAMLGNVFSPYYAWSRARGSADPLQHCALNVALYGESGKRWALTERGRGALQRDASTLRIGPSVLAWNGECLSIALEEMTVPLPSRIRGVVRLYPEALSERRFELDAAGRHHWSPLAACSRVEVDMRQPGRRWQGEAYMDSNWGTEPLEAGFRCWDWSRARTADGETLVLYDVSRRHAEPLSLALRIRPSGDIEEFAAPARQRLPTCPIWRIPRATRSDSQRPPRVLKTLEDTPFYARSMVQAALGGDAVTAVHESLSLDRFRRNWVRMLLPFRMPRRP